MHKRTICCIVGVLFMCFLTADVFAQRRVAFDLRCNVRGAIVTLDGRAIGKTPFRGQVPVGTHIIRVSARGYATAEQRVVFRGPVRLTMDLRRIARRPPPPPPRHRSYSLRISANVRGAQVFIDNKSYGNAPARAELRRGRHRIKVEARGYDDYETTIDLNRDMSIDARLRRRRPPPPPPRPRTHSLRISANVRGAQVFIDNRSYGNAPARAELRPGRYRIKVVARGYDDYETTIDLNRDLSINAQLRPRRPPPPPPKRSRSSPN